MQVIHQNENEREVSREVDISDLDVCVGRIGRCVEREHFGRFGIRDWEFLPVGEQLAALKREFRRGDSESVSGAVHTGVEVCRMYSEMSGLVERPWLQLMCCAVCLPRGRNFR